MRTSTPSKLLLHQTSFNFKDFLNSVAKLLKALFSQQLGSKGLWFNPHPRHVIAYLDKTLYDVYLCLMELKQTEN